MNDIAVVLDTNVYRDLSDRKRVIDPIAETEKYLVAMKSCRISAYASPFVLMELAAHLADITDPHYDECRSALRAQHHVCSISSGQQLKTIIDSESLVLKALYNVILPESSTTTEQLAKLSHYIYKNTPGVIDEKRIIVCKQLKTHLDHIETQFVSDMWQYVVQQLKPATTGWAPLENDKSTRSVVLESINSKEMLSFIAHAFVIKAMVQARRNESATDVAAKAKLISDKFNTSIQLYREILKRIVETGCNIDKPERRNWIWDMQIALGVGQMIGDDHKELHLVSTDKAILRAAESSGARQYVHSLAEFKKDIGM
jgi:hypothetical protein